MKIKIIFFTLLVIFLISCTNTNINDYEKTKEIILIENSTEENHNITRDENGIIVENETTQADIIIKGTELFPNNIKIPLENTTELKILNEDNLTYRLEIPMFGSEKQRTIYPYEGIILKLNPKVKGIVPIKFGQFTLGTIEVQ